MGDGIVDAPSIIRVTFGIANGSLYRAAHPAIPAVSMVFQPEVSPLAQVYKVAPEPSLIRIEALNTLVEKARSQVSRTTVASVPFSML